MTGDTTDDGMDDWADAMSEQSDSEAETAAMESFEEEGDGLKAVDHEKMDVILAPLLGFDNQGHRLGMGGGFYDRTLESVKGQSKPIIIGLAFECQRIDAVPTEAWDIPSDAILTENGLAYFSS